MPRFAPIFGAEARHPALRDVSVIPIRDPLEDEQWQLLKAHPGFRTALEALREDLEAAYGDSAREQFIVDLMAEPERAPYPVRSLAEEWGVAPFIVFGLALDSTDEWLDYFRDRANGILVWNHPANSRSGLRDPSHRPSAKPFRRG